jgi:hypothetical protein
MSDTNKPDADPVQERVDQVIQRAISISGDKWADYVKAWMIEDVKQPDADPVHDRVDQVIQDMTAGKVIPRKVDELSTAVDRAKRDQAVHRVTK